MKSNRWATCAPCKIDSAFHPTAVVGKPQAEFEITKDLVRALLADQHPVLADLPLAALDAGWDNAMFRVGDALTVRAPRREIADQLILNEQRWLPVLADRLPIPTPVPRRLGKPNAVYPWHWSVLRWFEGQGADQAPPSSGEVAVLADFLLKLHQPAPVDAPENPVRGVPIAHRVEATQIRIARVRNSTNLIGPAIERIWGRGLAAPSATDARWLHGDLHAQNVLVANGKITAIIDWGDVTSGDVATDLAATWGLFERRADRNRLLDLYAPDQATLDRAMAWAVMFGVVLLDSGLANSPRHAVQGRDLLSRLAEDA